MTTPELGRSSMADHPVFEHWDRHQLNEWAHGAYDKLIAQDDTIHQLRLDLKNAMKLVGDDWK